MTPAKRMQVTFDVATESQAAEINAARQEIAPNSAGAIAGLTVGDRISSINSQPVSQLEPSDALVIFAGPIGSNVDLRLTPKDGGAARLVHIQPEELLPKGGMSMADQVAAI